MKETRFKQTEIGLIPEDWSLTSIGSIGEICMCKRVLKEQTSETGDIPFFKIGTFGQVPDAFISRALYCRLKKKYNYPQKGDLLLSAAGTIGRVVVYDGKDAYFQDSNIIWLSHKEDKVRNGFLRYWYLTAKWVTEEGGIVSRLYNDNFKAMQLALPPISEQRKIAETLGDMDALIAELDKLIAKKRLIKQGTMQQLLTGRTRLKGFNEPWKKENLQCLGTFRSGDFTQPENIFEGYLPNLYPCYGGNGLRGFTPFFNHQGKYILVGRVGALCGNVHLISGRFQATEHALVFENLIEISDEWLSFLLTYIELGQYAIGNAQPVLTQANLGKIRIPIPTLAEQRAIASILTDIDTEISELEKKKAKYEKLKQGMMQQLLTGRIRLI